MTERLDPIQFCKMSGAGNDFIVFDGSSGPPHPDMAWLTRALCTRRTAVGADGVILVEPSAREDADVRVRFWNPDGSEAETCGNGTRCAARFALVAGLAPAEMMIETTGSDIEARAAGDVVALTYRTAPAVDLGRRVTGADGQETGHLVKIGLPHLVVQVDELPEGAIEPRSRPLRSAPELGPAGANVHLVEVVDRHRLRIRSYERGVEEETWACGSGSISSAVALCAAGQVDSPVAVETHSGEVLTIRFEHDGQGGFANVALEGPARVVYWGELRDSDLDLDE